MREKSSRSFLIEFLLVSESKIGQKVNFNPSIETTLSSSPETTFISAIETNLSFSKMVLSRSSKKVGLNSSKKVPLSSYKYEQCSSSVKVTSAHLEKLSFN